MAREARLFASSGASTFGGDPAMGQTAVLCLRVDTGFTRGCTELPGIGHVVKPQTRSPVTRMWGVASVGAENEMVDIRRNAQHRTWVGVIVSCRFAGGVACWKRTKRGGSHARMGDSPSGITDYLRIETSETLFGWPAGRGWAWGERCVAGREPPKNSISNVSSQEFGAPV